MCGGLARRLAQGARPLSREIVGIEFVPEAAADARTKLDRVLEGDLEEMVEPYPPGYFDCIVYGDVLEHLRDPGRVLARHRGLLAPDGEIVVSIPNIGHASIFRDLLAGRFPYADAGILDRTHLRFFTPASFGQLLMESGFEVRRADASFWPDPEMAVALEGLAKELGIENPTLVDQVNAYQILFRAGHPQRGPLGGFELADRRGLNFMLVFGSGEQLARTLAGYLEAFDEADDVALHVLAPNANDLYSKIVEIIVALGKDPDRAPDVSLVERSWDVSLVDYLSGADVVIGAGDFRACLKAVEAVDSKA